MKGPKLTNTNEEIKKMSKFTLEDIKKDEIYTESISLMKNKSPTDDEKLQKKKSICIALFYK